MEAILYVLASKFLDNEKLELIKEAITMTKLGQMIWDDAIEVGEKRASEYRNPVLYLRRRPIMICALLLFYSTNE